MSLKYQNQLVPTSLAEYKQKEDSTSINCNGLKSRTCMWCAWLLRRNSWNESNKRTNRRGNLLGNTIEDQLES